MASVSIVSAVECISYHRDTNADSKFSRLGPSPVRGRSGVRLLASNGWARAPTQPPTGGAPLRMTVSSSGLLAAPHPPLAPYWLHMPHPPAAAASHPPHMPHMLPAAAAAGAPPPLPLVESLPLMIPCTPRRQQEPPYYVPPAASISI